MKKTLVFLVVVCISCGQIITQTPKKDYERIYKNLTNAESIENLVQKNKLLNTAYTLIMQRHGELVKEKKSDATVASLLAYYYFLKGNYQDAGAQAELAQSISTGTDPIGLILQARILLATKGKAGAGSALDILRSLEGLDNPMAYIATGDAYFLKSDYDKARDNYTKALLLNKELQVVAANRLEVISRIKTLTIDVAKVSDFILEPVITRDKLAHLLYEIFEIQKYITVTKPLPADFIDLAKSHYASAVSALRSKGFFSYIQGNTFEPFMVVSRGEMAKVVEDFLVLSRNNEGLRTKYKDESPPFFNDIKTDNVYYNALRLACDMEIMSVSLSQEAYPDESVTGLQAIMIIQKLIK
ncbi:MAG: S-layer homology domain-containing protein [Spirochaetes bacterium]|nr:S-layer homology domain-containing protein [Spirochaetota bacterium]